MKYKIGIDVGGTFTDFLLTMEDGSSEIYKVLSTPQDPSIGTMKGIGEMAEARGLGIEEFLKQVTTIVHGTTVTTNAVLTLRGAKTGLLTTPGVRDARAEVRPHERGLLHLHRRAVPVSAHQCRLF